METIAELTARFPKFGRLEFIGLRPARRLPVRSVSAADVGEGGLAGDHRSRPGPRAVTLIQWEHLPVIAALCGLHEIDPALLRRNLAVSGINLTALKGRQIRIGNVVLEAVDVCAPCSRMEQVLGPGGYNAMRGHGGITAMVVRPGELRLGDQVAVG